MSFRRQSSAVAVSVLALATSGVKGQTTAPAASTGLGDPAPAIAVADWVKGTPVSAFTPGQVYVVEFWATWCAPCKKAIPHLTELANQYEGKVTFVGVSVWERPKDKTDAAVRALVERFVTAMGEKMDYHVAYDGTAGVMATTWLDAAKQKGIPASFVIDGQGRIAWIGLPTGLDAVLEKVTSGTWDIAAEKKRAADALAADAERTAAMDAIMTAFQAKDDKAVLKAIDAAEKKYPGTVLHPDLISVKFQALLRTDPPAAVTYVKTLMAADGIIAKKPDFVWSILRVLPDSPGNAGLSATDWKTIADAVIPSMASAKPFASLYEKHSIVLDQAGDRTAAITAQKEAVRLSSAYNDSHPGELTTADTEQLERMTKRLNDLTKKP